jgi:glycosyltransferase involved in cell wall biosynthesis
MHVLFLNDAVFEDLPGGSRVVARELARGLIRHGHDVTFLVPRRGPEPPDNERRDGMRIVRYQGLGQGLKFVRSGQAACARLWDEVGPFDLIHAHFAYAALGPLRAVPSDVPCIRSFYGPWDQEGWVEDAGAAVGRVDRLRALTKRWMRRRVEAINLHRSQAVTVLSEQSRGEVLRFRYPSARITLVPGGVDSARFVPAPGKREVRRQLGLPENRRLLLSVRRLAARMGLDRLIAAMPAVVAQHPDVLLLIGGQGPESQRLGQMIQALNLQANVRLVGFIPDDQLTAYYQAADLFVLPTLALEGFGLVTVEALACGTPVVGTPIGATPEILGRLDDRLITQDATAGALSKSILAFLAGGWSSTLTPDRLHRLVEECYTWELHTDAVEAVYADVFPRKALIPKPVNAHSLSLP